VVVVVYKMLVFVIKYWVVKYCKCTHLILHPRMTMRDHKEKKK